MLRLRLRVPLTLALFLVSLPSRADEAVPNILPPQDHGARTLRGHTYQEPATQDTPFITSHVGVRQGVSYYSVPGFPVSRDRKSDLALFALTERLDLQVRLLPWLAIYGSGEASVITGLDQASFFYGQSSYLAGGRGGPVVRLYRSRETGTQLTLRGTIGGSAGNELALPGFVQALAVRTSGEASSPPATIEETNTRLSNAVSDLSNAAVADTSLLTYGGGLHFAQTLFRPVGIQSSFVLTQVQAVDERFVARVQRRETTDTTDTSMRFAIAVSFDAYPLGVPLALLGEYAVEKTYRVVDRVGTDESVYVPSAHLLGAGLFYSGRTDLQLGLSAFARRNLVAQRATALDGTTATTGIPTALYAQFVVRYVWN